MEELPVTSQQTHFSSSKLVLAVFVLIALAFGAGFVFGQRSAMTRNIDEILTTPSISPSVALSVPSLIPTEILPTTSIELTPEVVLHNNSLKQCMDQITKDAMAGYQEFCENWKKENNSNGCPGIDLVDEVYKPCYDKYGRP